MRAILVGKTIVGMQVYDALRLFDHLAASPEVEAARISVLGKGHGGIVGLYAAALEPRIAKVALEGAQLSYMNIVRANLHQNVIEIVVPGVLRDFDLPDMAAAVAPRAVWIVAPRSPSGARVSPVEAAAEYLRSANLRIADRRSFSETYTEWMRR
jgi:hypothetical protein